jgi:hypothetical protein
LKLAAIHKFHPDQREGKFNPMPDEEDKTNLGGSEIKGKVEWCCAVCREWFEVPWDYRARPENCPKCDIFLGNKCA